MSDYVIVPRFTLSHLSQFPNKKIKGSENLMAFDLLKVKHWGSILLSLVKQYESKVTYLQWWGDNLMGFGATWSKGSANAVCKTCNALAYTHAYFTSIASYSLFTTLALFSTYQARNRSSLHKAEPTLTRKSLHDYLLNDKFICQI